MNVYDRANELARELKVTPEVIEYREAAKKLEQNPAAKKMIDDLRQKQIELYTMQMQGMQISQEQMGSLNNLGSVVSMNPEARAFLEAEFKFSKLYDDIMKIIGEAVGLNPMNGQK